jgi:FkbM family methyltransferase
MLAQAMTYLKSIPIIRKTTATLRGIKIHTSDFKIDDCILGSDYGGWSVDITRLTEASIIYSFGVGEDLSFDLELIRAVNCEVYAFDPTPIAINWVKSQALPTKLIFIPTGVAGTNGDVEFQIPPIEGWHSYSLEPEPGALQKGIINCPVKTIGTIMAELGHHHIDVLKLDVEGFEYEVLDSMINDNIRPRFLLVEFHHLVYGIASRRTYDAVTKLKAFGYVIYWISDGGREYGFIDVKLK